MKRLLILALPALALLLNAPTYAGDEDSAAQREELQRAREELQRAREELRRAAEELARVAKQTDGDDSPRAWAYEFLANPDRAMLGVTIAKGPQKDGAWRGVLVTGVTPGGGAEKAGLQSGDLLVSANGQPLASKDGVKGPERKLRDIMSALKPGDEVKVDYEREGKRKTVVVVAARQESLFGPMLGWKDEGDFDVLLPPLPPDAPRAPLAVRIRDAEPDFGLQLARLDSDLAAYFKTREGVLVVQAPREGSLGLKSGDVIVRIDQHAVASPVEVWDQLADVGKDQKIKVEVVRQTRTVQLEGTLPEPQHRVHKRIEIRRETP